MPWIANLVAILLLLPIALILRSGRGAFLIAGYNTSPKEKREQYDEKALCRFVGNLLLLACVPLVLGGILSLIPAAAGWGMTLSWGLYIAVLIGGVVYANTGNRFKNNGSQ